MDIKMISNMYISLFVLGALLVLSGCETITSKDHTLLDETASLCFSKAECDIKWSAAKEWASNHSNLKLHIYSDDFIEADDSTKDSRHLAFIIRKQPTANPGVYAISLNVWCNNMSGCFPPIKDAISDFNKYVNSTVTHGKSYSVTNLKNGDIQKPKSGFRAGIVNNKIIVKTVNSGSPAQNAGLMANDIIIACDNTQLTDMDSFINLMKNVRFGDTKHLRIQRGNDILDLSIVYPTLDETKFYAPQSETVDTKAKNDDN
ncbi:MAG: PDZ domain-containing protein [Syntrophobacteraceae bacterium]